MFGGTGNESASWTVPTCSDDWSHSLLSTANAFKPRNWGKAARNYQFERRFLPSWQCQTKHIFTDWWAVLMHHTYILDLAPSDYCLFRYLQNSLIGVKLSSKESVKITWFSFRPEIAEVLQWCHNVFTRKMTKEYRSKWHRFGLIKFIYNIKKMCLKFGEKTPEFLSLTQYFLFFVFFWEFTLYYFELFSRLWEHLFKK